MKALICSQYGSPGSLTLGEVERPQPRDDQVLIAVRAASINDWDWGILEGSQLVIRLLYGLRRPRIRILGCDVAGRVEAVGRNVTRFRPGDEVFGDLCQCGFGAFAEYVCAPETALTRKPSAMSFVQAAATPQASMLAVQGLQAAPPLRPGQRLLLNGAGGGVGTFALQLAKPLGIEITAVDSGPKLEVLRDLGADHTIDYTKEDFTRTGKRYDLVLDVKTNRSPREYARVLSPGGTYVTVGGAMTRVIQVALFGLVRRRAGNGKRLRVVALEPNRDLAYMVDLFEAGRVTPLIDGPYPFDAIRESLQRFGEGTHQGKVVVTMDG